MAHRRASVERWSNCAADFSRGERAGRRVSQRFARFKFAGHFHGWHEGLEIGVQAPYEAVPGAGQLPAVVEAVSLCPPNDIEAVRQTLAGNDIAAVILEPTGGHFGAVPVAPGLLSQLRDATSKAGTLLIFDEVVTGFRVAPGGAQELSGVTPDLATYAKILAGGLPGGAVAGREDIMAFLATKATPEETHRTKMHHAGTYNANPLSATAGVAMLASVADGAAIRLANEQAAKLRAGMNEILAQQQVAWKVYGQHSDWKMFYGADAPPRGGDDQSVDDIPWQRLDASHAAQSRGLRQAMILRGVDFNGARALVGTCHTDEVITDTLDGFAEAVRLVRQAGLA